jgi:hypothetical protein
MEDAIVISEPNEVAGVRAEWAYLSSQCGRQNVDWTLQYQAVTDEQGDGRRYDIFSVRLRDGEVRKYYFDITQFYGR